MKLKEARKRKHHNSGLCKLLCFFGELQKQAPQYRAAQQPELADSIAEMDFKTTFIAKRWVPIIEISFVLRVKTFADET